MVSKADLQEEIRRMWPGPRVGPVRAAEGRSWGLVVGSLAEPAALIGRKAVKAAWLEAERDIRRRRLAP